MFKVSAVAFVAALSILPAVGSGQTVAIVSGNGQLVCPVCPGLVTQAFAPLVVSVTDASGKPLANTTVTWTATPGAGSGISSPTTAQTTTDASGQASYTFPLVLPYPGYSFLQTSITATVGASTVSFIESTAVPASGSPGPPIYVTLLTPLPATSYSGTAGTTSSTLIKVQVYATQSGVGGGLAGVSLQLLPGDTGGATLSCQTQPGQPAGTVLTDSTGTATCTPVFGPTIGTGSYQVTVGGMYAMFLPGKVTVTAGPPAIIKILSGDQQSVNPGMLAPLPLVAEVTDLGGNPVETGTVSWSITPSTAKLSNVSATPIGNGQVSARVTAGGGGPILVTAKLANTNSQVTFTITVNVVITDLQAISGNNQIANVGAAFADPLIVEVNNAGQPVAGITVSFALTSGAATLSGSTATTDANGQAQITVTAGDTAGAVTVTASISGSQIPAQEFDLTVSAGPILTADGFTNAASYKPQFISPCSLATIFGTGLATGLQGVVSSMIVPQMQLSGVSVQFAGVPAPILSIANQNGQESVNVQVPCEVTPGMVPATVTTASGSTTVMVNVLQVSPGIFQTPMSDGKLRAVLIRPNGTVVSLANPALRGEIIRMYVTGLGQTTPSLATDQFIPLVPDSTGALAPEALPVNAQVIVGVNNNGVRVVSAQYAYGMLGVYEVQFQVPLNTEPGNDAPFAIALIYNSDPNGVFGNPSLIPIQ
jgi:uncharacterized protein (TIGR03437 family)